MNMIRSVNFDEAERFEVTPKRNLEALGYGE